MNFFKKNFPLNREEKKQRNTERLLLILSGVLMGLSFPPFPFPFQLLMFIGLVPYFYVIEKKQKLVEINRATYLTFFIFSVITLYWVGSWQKSADPFLMIAGGLLLFVNPVFFLIPSSLLYIARKIFPHKTALLLFPLFWVTYEYLYMITDLSFPWLTLGNGLADFTVFIQTADIIGAVGLSLVVIYINIFIYKAVINYNTSQKIFLSNLSYAVVLFVVIIIYGLYQLKNFQLAKDKITVGIIQPNLDPWEKWERGNLKSLTKDYINLSQQAVDSGARFIVWPETALPVFLMDGAYQTTVGQIYNFLERNNVSLLTGMPDVRYYFKGDKIPNDAQHASNGNYYYTTYNAVYLLSPYTTVVQKYGKMKLVPFGERVPFVDQLPFLGKLIKWGVGLSGWNVGKDTLVFKEPYSILNNSNSKDTLKLNGLVCYESIYPYFVTNFVQRGARLIAVVTNDSWYGNSSGPYQHKEISILRAVENRRSVIRAANGGISCIINPLGITQVQTKMYTRTLIVGSVILQNDETFFTKHPLIIPVVSSMLSIWVIGIFILMKIRDKFLT